MDRRTITAIALCFLIYLGWQKYYLEPLARQSQPIASQTAQNPSATATSTTSGNQPIGAASTPAANKTHPPQTATLPTGTGEARIGDSGRIFTGWNLKSYKKGIAKEASVVDLESVTNRDGEVELAFDDPQLAYLNTVQGELKKTATGALWTYEDANVRLSREFVSSDAQMWVDLKITAEFKAKKPSYAFVSMAAKGMKDDPEARDRHLVYFANNSLERVSVQDSIKNQDAPGPVHFIGTTSRYFAMTLVAQAGEPRVLIQGTAPYEGRISLAYPVAANTLTIPLKVYFGPKELDSLRAVDPTLDHVVDLGWFTFIAYPLLKFLKWLYHFLHNYGAAIIVLTATLKICTYPLTYKSMKSMKHMAKLQPQLAKLREKHKDDKEALNREMLTMMRTHGYNPAAGCVPILIQMPVFFALYRVLYSSIELYHAPFALWIHDLSSKDPYYVTPILLSVTMFVQQKLSPQTATDPAQQRMMQLMPLIFGAFMISLPAGLTLYMLTNAITSIIQQLILNKKLDTKPDAAAVAVTR